MLGATCLSKNDLTFLCTAGLFKPSCLAPKITRLTLTRPHNSRPEKKHLTGYSGMPGTSGVGRESPIGDDDNEEVRQRAEAR